MAQRTGRRQTSRARDLLFVLLIMTFGIAAAMVGAVLASVPGEADMANGYHNHRQ